MEKLVWHKAQVSEGNKIGRTIGFPTINLDPTILPEDQPEGVYASLVRYNGRRYTGALYLGPRQVLGETHRVLEIHLLNFKKNIYGEEVDFSLLRQVRGLVNLSSLDALEQQMELDIQQIREAVGQFRETTQRRKTS